jgi:hypothetical protein
MALVIGGIDLQKVNYKYVFYVLFSILVVCLGAYSLYSQESLARTVIYVIGASLVFIFFGMRWFGNVPTPSALWPPTINMCPDYLTYVNFSPSGGGCVDMIGITSKAGGISKTLKSDVSSLNKDRLDKVVAFTSADVANSTATKMQEICDRCATAGVTWEGIYDGDICVGLNRFRTMKAMATQGNCPPSVTLPELETAEDPATACPSTSTVPGG